MNLRQGKDGNISPKQGTEEDITVTFHGFEENSEPLVISSRKRTPPTSPYSQLRINTMLANQAYEASLNLQQKKSPIKSPEKKADDKESNSSSALVPIIIGVGVAIVGLFAWSGKEGVNRVIQKVFRK